MIDRALDRIGQLLLVAAALLAFALAFVVCTDVGGRYFLGMPLKGTPELVSMAIVIICYLQAAYAVRSGGMIAVDALYANYPVRLKALVSLVSLVGSLLGVFLFALIFLGSYERAVEAWVGGEYEGEGALRVPAWPAKWALVTGALLVSASYLTLAVRQGLALVRGAEPPVTSTAH